MAEKVAVRKRASPVSNVSEEDVLSAYDVLREWFCNHEEEYDSVPSDSLFDQSEILGNRKGLFHRLGDHRADLLVYFASGVEDLDSYDANIRLAVFCVAEVLFHESVLLVGGRIKLFEQVQRGAIESYDKINVVDTFAEFRNHYDPAEFIMKMDGLMEWYFGFKEAIVVKGGFTESPESYYQGFTYIKLLHIFFMHAVNQYAKDTDDTIHSLPIEWQMDLIDFVNRKSVLFLDQE